MTNQRIIRDTPLIEPVYSQANPSDAISLRPVTVKFSHAGNDHQKTSNVLMRFTPAVKLCFHIPIESSETFKILAMWQDENWARKLTLLETNATFEILFSSVGSEAGIVFEPTTSVTTITQPVD